MGKKLFVLLTICLLLSLATAHRGRHNRKHYYQCEDVTPNCPENTEWSDFFCACVCKSQEEVTCDQGEWNRHLCACSTCDVTCEEPTFLNEETCTCECDVECDHCTERVNFDTCTCESKCGDMTCDSGVLDNESCTCIDEAYPHIQCGEDMIFDEEVGKCVCEQSAESPCEEGFQWDLRYCACLEEEQE